MPITGLPNILVSSSEFIFEKKPGDQDPASSFVKGQIVKARVVEVVSPRQVILLIDGKKLSAKTFVLLRPGQDIKLQATGTGTQPVLKLVEDMSGGLSDGYSALIKSWGKSGPFTYLAEVLAKDSPIFFAKDGKSPLEAFIRLRELVIEISLKSGDTAPHFLNNLIQGSGLQWEKKLLSLMATPDGLKSGSQVVEKDIKALVMQMLLSEREGHGNALENLRSFVDSLENLQLFNKSSDDGSGRYLLPLPVLIQGELKFGQMLLTLPDARKKSQEEDNALVKVSFLLTLTALGDLRADFSVLGHAVSGVFGVSTEEIKTFMAPRLIGLTERLLSHGYEVRNIGCRVVGAEALAETALFDIAIEGTQNGVLNVVI